MAESNPIVSEWIEKAEADWELVGLAASSGNSKLRDGVVYHAQQCIEKLLKARLLQLGQSLRKIHDLSNLSRQLQVCDSSW
jgi:HEPN domain-containing protein